MLRIDGVRLFAIGHATAQTLDRVLELNASWIVTPAKPVAFDP
jgi:hypothetical protein